MEDDEDAVLERTLAVVELEVDQTGDDGQRDVVEEARHAVGWGAPEGQLRALVDDLDLVPERRGVLSLRELRRRAHFSHALLFDTEDLLFGVRKLRGCGVNICPISVAYSWSCSGALNA